MRSASLRKPILERKAFEKYACRDSQAIRREQDPTEKTDYRPAFSIDVDRILNSRAYARYLNKTQVFSLVDNPNITHRSLHVQLVSRISRFISRALGLNEELTEAIALAHDIGHPPFGHDGESFLDELTRSAGIGRFRHHAEGVIVLDRIERKGRTGRRRKLNLTLQVLDGILSHNGEELVRKVNVDRIKTFAQLDRALEDIIAGTAESKKPGTWEAAVVRQCDVIAYIARDIEDAVLLGLVKWSDLPARAVAVLGDSPGRIVFNLTRDLVENSTEEGGIAFSEEVFAALKELKEFNVARIYLNGKIKKQHPKIKRMFELVFEESLHHLEEGREEAPVFSQFLAMTDEEYRRNSSKEEIVRDFIASMDDAQFLRVFHEIFVPQKFYI